MNDNIVIYVKNRALKKLVEREAKNQNMSTSRFVWRAILAGLGTDAQKRLKEIEAQENQ